VAVLGVAMIVDVIAITSMHIARIEIRAGVAQEELARAQLAAQSAVELAVAHIDWYPDWRTDNTHGAEVPNPTGLSLGTMANYKFELFDTDGDLADDNSDQVTIRGIGMAGGSTSVVSVTLQPQGIGLDCLKSALHSHGSLSGGSSDLITADQTISSNGSIDAAINGDAWAAGVIAGIVSGTSSPAQSPPREMPDAATVFDYYIANGTHITYSDIPSGLIDKQLVSPNNNPYGAETNPQGIYVIDCGGDRIRIQDSRILGTIILLNVGAGSSVEKDINWETAVANYPALMLQGDIELKWHGSNSLDENKINVNFNPVGTPYLDAEDTDQNDTYPALIKGLVYVSGDLKIGDVCNLEGTLVVGGACNVRDDLTITYDSDLVNNPPPGFTDGSVMQVMPGSWRRAAY